MALTSQQQAIQNQIDGFDSNTGTQVLLSTLLRAIDAGDIRQGYTDSAAFPTNDSDFIGFIGYDEYDSSLRYIGRDLDIHKIDSATASGVASTPKPVQQGTAYGYRSGGRAPAVSNIIDKYSYTSDGNATDVGDLTGPYYGRNQGASSTTDGYNFGGYYTPPGGSWYNGIEKYSFASDGNASDGGDLTTAFGEGGGHQSSTHGYASGGTRPPASTTNTIDKFPFADDGNATDVGDLLNTGRYAGGNGSDTHGYNFGGLDPSLPNGYAKALNKFPFATDANATDAGDMLSENAFIASHQQSLTAGFISGFQRQIPVPATIVNTIETFPFASDANSTDHADLNVTKRYANGNSSTTHAYSHGGQTPTVINNIEKFSTSSAANGTDVGDLTATTYMSAGAMY